MKGATEPSYVLVDVQSLCAEGRYQVGYTVLGTLPSLGFDESDVPSCIASLLPEHFDRTYRSKSKGSMNDVYKVEYGGKRLYVKFEVSNNCVYIISFHE